jgi:hypothetical protein
VREIRLYDSLCGQLVPVNAGDAIRVEVRTPPNVGEGGVDVESTRPLVLFGFLERFLQREGFGTKFLFDSPSGEDVLYEISEERASSASAAGASSERDPEMSLLEVSRSDVDRWVNVCFGAGRDGEEWELSPPCDRILLSDALRRFGHPAVALYLLGTHYSMPLGDPLRGLEVAARSAERIRQAAVRLAPDRPSPPDMRHYIDSFRDALADDLDTPNAFVILFEWLLEAERRGEGVGDKDLRVMLEVLELDDLAAPLSAA